jgi:holin-like protein
MIGGLLLLLACQLVGGFVVDAIDVPVPGPVLGMVLLLVLLVLRRPPEDAGVIRAADGLLQHLQLFFVPAGTGVVTYLAVIGAGAVPIVTGLVVSWAAALVATAVTAALVAAALARVRPVSPEKPPESPEKWPEKGR